MELTWYSYVLLYRSFHLQENANMKKVDDKRGPLSTTFASGVAIVVGFKSQSLNRTWSGLTDAPAP